MKTITHPTKLEIRLKQPGGVPALVKFTVTGHQIHFKKDIATGTSSRLSGYESPETLFAPQKWWAHDYREQLDHRPFEGVPYLDIREAVQTDAGIKMVYSGPMVDADLAAGEVDRCPEPSAVLFGALTLDPANVFGQLLALHRVKRGGGAGPLDGVGVREYLSLWRLAGGITGIIRQGRLVPDPCPELPAAPVRHEAEQFPLSL